MSSLIDITNYHRAVKGLSLVLGERKKFWDEFEVKYFTISRIADAENTSDSRNRRWERLGQLGEDAFSELKSWVIDNYPWPEKKS